MRHMREIDLIYYSLKYGSMVLTGYFGWTLGSFWWPLGIVMAFIFGAMSLAVGYCFEWAGRYSERHLYTHAIRSVMVGCLFAGFSVLTDYGSAAAIRNASTVEASNQNTLARDARAEVKRLEKRIGEIRATASWRSSFLAPGAYEKMIVAAELIRDNEAKRGGCGRICEQKTKELQQLRADKANAENRLALKAELVQLERELVEAKSKSADTLETASPALAQIKSLVSWVNFDRNITENKIFWGNNAIILIGALFANIGIIALAFERGLHVIQEGSQGQREQRHAAPMQLTSQTVSEPQERDSWRTHYESRTTVVERQDDSLRALQEQLAGLGQQLSGKAQKWQAQGTQ